MCDATEKYLRYYVWRECRKQNLTKADRGVKLLRVKVRGVGRTNIQTR